MSSRPDNRDWLHKVLWHLPFDWYCRAESKRGRHLPGWGLVQVGQWHVCQRYEERADRRGGRDWVNATELPLPTYLTDPKREDS